MLINPQQIIDQGILKGENFKCQQNGIDLTVKEIKEIGMSGGLLKEATILPNYYPISLDQDDCYHLKPGAYAIEFEQNIEIPNNMEALVIHRSSLNRMGASIISGLYDSGFKNQIGAVLRVSVPIYIEKGSRVAQIIFFEAESASLYSGQYQFK